MKHYGHLTEEQLEDTFYIKPSDFNNKSPKPVLSRALGATMYMPASRKSIADELLNQKHISLTSTVIDLEDALDSDNIEEGIENIFTQLLQLEEELEKAPEKRDTLPLLFIRVRNVGMLATFLNKAEKLTLLTGFILPKFSSENGNAYLEHIAVANSKLQGIHKFYAMPVLEASNIIYKETRLSELMEIKRIVSNPNFQPIILNIRLGGTDFSGLYSIRRSIDTTIYDINVVADCLTDILNLFSRAEDDYVISGVVWEFFSQHNRILKPNLREAPFIKSGGNTGRLKRKTLVDGALDGLIKETLLDRSNGIVGKTIIHPSHIRVVNALQVVNEEDYKDALMILENQGKGVMKSTNGNKMNEMSPHIHWATKLIEKSKVYGVLRNEKTYYDLL